MKFTFTLILAVLFSALQAKAPLLSAKELASPPPKIIRTCCSFGTEVRMAFLPFVKVTSITSLNNIGPHEFMGGKTEGNGIIYTERGGFVDLGHLRDIADWTAFLFNKIIEAQQLGEDLDIPLAYEGGKKMLRLSIPQHLDKPNRARLAGKIAYDISLWHEIATWFGSSYVPLIPERYSSFSPEDLYSNLLGVELGIKAILSDQPFNEAMTYFLGQQLADLGAVVTDAETLTACEAVKEIWWTRERMLPHRGVLLKRYFGSTSFLSPWLLPGQEDYFTPHVLQIPRGLHVDFNDFYELSFKLNWKFPKKLMEVFREDRKITQLDFAYIVDFIRFDLTGVSEPTMWAGSRP